jgi:hypothetical protein
MIQLISKNRLDTETSQNRCEGIGWMMDCGPIFQNVKLLKPKNGCILAIRYE